MDLTDDDIEQILELVATSKEIELRLEFKGLKLHIRRGQGDTRMVPSTANQQGVATETPHRVEQPTLRPRAAPKTVPAIVPAEGSRALADNQVAIKAPMLGTFYRAPSPSAKAFVEIGDVIKAGDAVCLIELMKLFNTIHADVPGRVISVLVENGALVQHEQELMLIEVDET